MPVGKNLLIKQPHPSKTCTMYYLQHRRLQHTCNASSFRRTMTQKTNLVATYHINNTLSHTPIDNPKNAHIIHFPFQGNFQRTTVLGFYHSSEKQEPNFFFGLMPQTPHVSQRLECTILNDQLPHVFTSSPIIKSFSDSSYTPQEYVITILAMISLHTIQDANTYKWSNTSTCQLDMYTCT